MNITEISVSYEETCSLPGYSNVRPGIRLAAQIESDEDAESVRNFLMNEARGFVHDQVDQALMDNGKAPKYKYYSGPRFKVMISHRRKIVLIVPQHCNDCPDDFYNSSSIDYDLHDITLDQAERYAHRACDQRDGYLWATVTDGNYSELPPLPAAEGLADEGDYPDDDDDDGEPPF